MLLIRDADLHNHILQIEARLRQARCTRSQEPQAHLSCNPVLLFGGAAAGQNGLGVNQHFLHLLRATKETSCHAQYRQCTWHGWALSFPTACTATAATNASSSSKTATYMHQMHQGHYCDHHKHTS